MMRGLYFILALLLIAIVIVLGLQVGSFESDLATIAEAFLNYNPDNTTHYAILHLRLPRLLLALVVGAALAFCGYLMQAMVNNGLADPYLLGTASGASLGAVLVFFGFINISIGGFYMPPVLAMAGAFIVTLVVVILGYRKRQLIPAQLLLAGIAISSLCTAMVGLLTFLSDSEGKLKSVIFWSMGSFERASWTLLPYPAIALIVALILFAFMQKQLNILMLGSERAQALGRAGVAYAVGYIGHCIYSYRFCGGYFGAYWLCGFNCSTCNARAVGNNGQEQPAFLCFCGWFVYAALRSFVPDNLSANRSANWNHYFVLWCSFLRIFAVQKKLQV
jgi:ABC-type enterobactin transport system permease subunit